VTKGGEKVGGRTIGRRERYKRGRGGWREEHGGVVFI
jgi:hypothetical protein